MSYKGLTCQSAQTTAIHFPGHMFIYMHIEYVKVSFVLYGRRGVETRSNSEEGVLWSLDLINRGDTSLFR